MRILFEKESVGVLEECIRLPSGADSREGAGAPYPPGALREGPGGGQYLAI